MYLGRDITNPTILLSANETNLVILWTQECLQERGVHIGGVSTRRGSNAFNYYIILQETPAIRSRKEEENQSDACCLGNHICLLLAATQCYSFGCWILRGSVRLGILCSGIFCSAYHCHDFGNIQPISLCIDEWTVQNWI